MIVNDKQTIIAKDDVIVIQTTKNLQRKNLNVGTSFFKIIQSVERFFALSYLFDFVFSILLNKEEVYPTPSITLL